MNINRIFRNVISYKVNKRVLMACFLFAAFMPLKSYTALPELGNSLIGVENCQDYPKSAMKQNQVSKKLHENVTHKEKKRSEQRRCGKFLSKKSVIGKNDSGEKPKIPQLHENAPKDDNQNTPPLILSRGTELLGLLNSDPKKLAQDYIVNKLNNQITSNTQKWLSQFGTAKINLNVDHHGRLDESSVDLLVPFYDDKDHWLVYSQYGYRHKDSRDTVNLGIGTRLFINNWMYGANTFYDNDLTGNNSRFSLGGELWTNYLKMSANAYFRLSDWHNSRDLTNYYERPANGYDLIADMYLPAMPSLGAKIKYEQYFGDNVALFGKDNRQKDPYAATIGVNYTPIPLITAGVDYKLGKDGKSDGIFSFNVNYRFGVPLSEQLSPENVSSLRSLAGNRYDLVERNNNIILNYLKKPQRFRLLVPVLEISGYGGEIKPIQIQSDTSLKDITWEMPELFQKHGGIINIESTHGYTIQLPEYQPDGKNDYTITGTSKDGQQGVQIQTHVLQRNISLSVNTTDPLIADGNAKYVYTATLLGADKKTPIENAKLIWDTDKKDPGLKLKPDSEATDKNGQQTATLTSTTPLSDIQVSVSINGERVTTDKKVSFTESSNSYRVSSVTVEVDKDQVRYNNGSDTYTFTAMVVDAHGKPVADKPIDIDWQTNPKTDGLKLTKQSNAVSNAQGQVTATLTSTAAVKDVQVSAKTATQQTAVNANRKVSFTEYSASYYVASVTVDADDKDKVRYNNGADSYTFTATVKDGHGNLVVGKPVDIDWQTDKAVAGLKLTKQSSPVSNAQGQVTATLSSTVAVSDVQVSAKTAAQQTAENANGKVSFTEYSASYYVASVTVDADKDKEHYNNGSDSYTFTATVKDGHGNLVVGKPVDIDWQTDPKTDGLKLTKQSNAVSNAQGQVTATLSSTVAVSDVQVSAKTVTQQTAENANGKVSFTEYSASYYVASVTVDADDKDKAHYNNGSDSYTFTATVKDGHGNLVVGKPVDIDWQTDSKADGLKLTKQSDSVSNAQGQVTATLTSTAAVKDVQVSAKATANPSWVKADSPVSFEELSSSYQVTGVTVEVDKDKKRYNNGKDSYTFMATVVDAHGKPVADKPIEIDWQTDPTVEGLTLTKQNNSVSNAQGQVTATLTSTAAVRDVQVSAKAAANPSWVDADQKVSFEELSHSYRVTGVTVEVDKDEKRYNNGTDSYTFTATVVDAHGKPVADKPIDIDWQTNPKADGLTLTKQSNAVSNAQGQVTATLTSTAAVRDVQVSAKAAANPSWVDADQKVSFEELSHSYRVTGVTVEVDKDEKRYNNGTDSYTFTATVVDAHGKPVADKPIDIDWQTNPKADGLTLTKQSNAVSNAQGQVTATLTSTAAVRDVQVSAKAAANPSWVDADQKVSFEELSHSYRVTGVTVDADKDKEHYNNGTDSYTFTATVKDGHGNLVVGKPVDIDWQTNPTVDGLKLTKQSNAVSNAQGQVTATLTSTAVVSDVQVSAKTATQQTAENANGKVSFTEYSASYYVASVTVDVDKDKAHYNNGSDSYTFTATVKDGHGNLVVGKPVDIDWQTDPKTDGLKLTKQSNAVSNAQGQVTATLSSTVAVSDVQVSAKTVTQQTAENANGKVSFTEYSASYYVASVTVDADQDKAHYNNGRDSYTFTATVVDGHGKPVADKAIDIDWQTNSKVDGLTLTKQNNSVSNAQGQVTATLTSTVAVKDVQVSAKTATQQTAENANGKVSFTEYSASYYVASVTVEVDKDKKRYNNGTDSYTFTATVKDGHGNLVVGKPVDIDWQTDSKVDGLKLTKQSDSVSNAQGQVTATLTSTVRVSDVQISAKAAANPSWVDADQKVSFEELSHSYRVTSVTVDADDKDKAHYNNGSDSYTFTATVKDGHGNLVVGKPVDIDWQTNSTVDGLTLTKQSDSVSNAQGQVTATLTSTAAVKDVQVSAKTATQQTAENANGKVSFTEYSASYYVASVTVDADDKDKAHYNNGSDSYTFTATVKDGHGNLVVGKPVDIDWQTDAKVDGLTLTKQSNSVSNALGQVTATLASTAAVKDVQVSAKAAANPSWVDADQKVSFEELSHSYRVASVTVEVDKDKEHYNNGSDSYTFTATVVDGHGKPVADKAIDIDWQTDAKVDGLTLTKQSDSVSNAQGQVTATLTSTVAVKDVQVSAKTAANPSWVDADQKVSFEELSHSYRVTGVTVEVDKDKEHYNNGIDSYTFTATVKDGHGNLVVDKPIDIDWQTDAKVDGLKLTKQSDSVSNSQGQVTATLSSTVVAIDVQVSAKTATQQTPMNADKKVSFISPDELASLTVSPDHVTEGEGEGHTYTFTATVKDFSGQAKSGATVAWSVTNSEGVTIADENLVTQVVGDGKTDADGKAQYQVYSKSGGFVAVMVTAKVNDSSVGSKNKTVEIKANEQDVTGFFIMDYDTTDGKPIGSSVPKERMNFAWPKMRFNPEYLPGKLTIAGYTGVYDSSNRNIIDVDRKYFQVKKAGTATLTTTFTHPKSGRYLKYIIPDVKIDHFVIVDSSSTGPGIGYAYSEDRIDTSKPLPRCTRGNRIKESDLGSSIDYLVNDLNLNLLKKGLLGNPTTGLVNNKITMGGLYVDNSIQAHLLNKKISDSGAYVVLCEE
ncbi:Ig-like domain-containing protein [Photorhabdus hainanensis]|uniref:Ig-like domain-containing protein n=1 Tax=Photorhabdus hainanensis TaxID=1004166 RepID=UPI001BD3594E|nr:Ig-like domain-containing protein [Photorhabdus hainanensis]